MSSPVYAFMLNEVEMASSPVPVKAAKEHAEGPFAFVTDGRLVFCSLCAAHNSFDLLQWQLDYYDEVINIALHVDFKNQVI